MTVQEGGSDGGAQAAGTRVAAVMAADNRRELTLACLRSLRAEQVPGVTLDAFVLDDASTDGTGCSVWVEPGTVGTCAPHPERRPGERHGVRTLLGRTPLRRARRAWP